MQEKVIYPICKQFDFKSRVYPINWNTYFQTIGGYYDEDGNYIKSDIVSTLKESFSVLMVIIGFQKLHTNNKQ